MDSANQILVFDRALVRRRRNRAAPGFSDYSMLFDESAACLLDRLADIKREFRTVLVLGARESAVAQELSKGPKKFVVVSDISERMLRKKWQNSSPLEGEVRRGGVRRSSNAGFILEGEANVTPPPPTPPSRGGEYVFSCVADEEFLPFAANSFDLVISNLSLHWVNDLPGTFAQIKNILRPDGLFLATLFGGQTLHELRTCLLEAEMAVTGGASPRLSPTIELPTASGLLQRAGFVLPVADQENFTLTYSDMFALMRDLRGMGETNTHLQRLKHPTRRAVFMEAARLYQERYALEDGHIPATFGVLFLHGWKN